MSIQELVNQSRDILNNMPVAFSICDRESRFVFMNRAYENLFGIKMEEYMGEYSASRVMKGETSFHSQVLKSGMPYSGPKHLNTKQKNKYLVWCEAQPIIVEGEIIGSISVIIEFNNASQMLQKMNDVKKAISRALETKAKYSFQDIRTESSNMQAIVYSAKHIAEMPVTVLLRGESGTGKELFAHSIHGGSRRKNKPFIRVNCAAISESLLESILFGYVGNSFTGAKSSGQVGLFEAANGGTLFLDEIGEVSMTLQEKLLRVLQEGEIMRVGDVKPIEVDVRIIAATNANLERKIKEGTFRQDLYYRLNVFPLFIPPLRERKGDIRPLSRLFAERLGRKYEKPIDTIEEEFFQALENYDWPGNIRELENVISRSILISEGRTLRKIDMASSQREFGNVTKKELDDEERRIGNDIIPYEEQFAEWEAKVYKEAYEISGRNKSKAARALNVSVRTLYDKLNKYGIQ